MKIEVLPKYTTNVLINIELLILSVLFKAKRIKTNLLFGGISSRMHFTKNGFFNMAVSGKLSYFSSVI